MNNTKYKIGFTIGEPTGIGPELIIKLLQNKQLLEYITPVIFAASRIFTPHSKRLNFPKISNITYISNPAKVKTDFINIVNIGEFKAEITFGQPTQKTGSIARKSLQRGVKWLKENNIDALITLPIDKNNIKTEEFQFNGHTDYLEHVFNTKTLMFMVHENIKVAVLTNHIPVKEIADKITPELVETKLRILINSLIQDFGINKPKIAVLGLNPHAGDKGTIGTEEQEIILPALQKVEQENKAIILGCYPADSFFSYYLHEKFDAVLAMYHDQGLIPFKYISKNEGVNFTAGLPVVRTSPAHGTAYDIAGKGIASEKSLLNAVFTAIDIIKQRNLFHKQPEPLQPQNPDEVRHFINSKKKNNEEQNEKQNENTEQV